MGLCGDMEPIVPIVEPKPIATPSRGTTADLIACIIAGLASLVAFGYSVLFFSRFLENDTHIWGIVSAFLLCFGVGAFGYIPAGITSHIAWKAYKGGAARRGLIVVFILLVPWICLSFALLLVSDMPKIYSITMLITVTLLTAWTLISLRNLHKR